MSQNSRGRKPLWTAVTVFLALGFRLVVPNPESTLAIYLGWLLWLPPAILLAIIFWQHFSWPLWIKTPSVCLFAVVFLWAAYRNIVGRLEPSFVFVAPGVVVNGDSWDFITNHRGPKSSSNVQILFIDEDRRNYLTRTQTYLTPSDISSYQALWSLPEVNPGGRGSIFAQQFIWKPFNFQLSHLTAEITWRDGTVHEDIRIARVDNKWQYLMQVTDPESGKKLISCRDKDFPSSEVLVPCFPDVVKMSN